MDTLSSRLNRGRELMYKSYKLLLRQSRRTKIEQKDNNMQSDLEQLAEEFEQNAAALRAVKAGKPIQEQYKAYGIWNPFSWDGSPEMFVSHMKKHGGKYRWRPAPEPKGGAESEGNYCSNSFHLPTSPAERAWREVSSIPATQAMQEACDAVLGKHQISERPTPRTDSEAFEVWTREYGIIEVTAADFARTLERELAEAREEKDSYAALYRDEIAIVDRVWKALGITTYEEANGKEISQSVAELRALAEHHSQVAAVERMAHGRTKEERDKIAEEFAKDLLNFRRTGADLTTARERIRDLEKERDFLKTCINSPAIKRNQPCGCIICICEDDERCHGCGAKTAEHQNVYSEGL